MQVYSTPCLGILTKTAQVSLNAMGVVAGPILLVQGGAFNKDGFWLQRVCSNGFIINPYYNENMTPTVGLKEMLHLKGWVDCLYRRIKKDIPISCNKI